MLHRSDIESDVKAGNLSGVEDGFRALVNWPGEDTIAGVDTAEDAATLLEGVATSLEFFEDARAMPGEIVDMLKQVRRGRGGVLSGGTYKAAATFVLEHFDWWHALFVRTLPGRA